MYHMLLCAAYYPVPHPCVTSQFRCIGGATALMCSLLLQLQTVERPSRALRVVGFALVGLFLDPKTAGQPVSRSIQDYVLNQGAFQVKHQQWDFN